MIHARDPTSCAAAMVGIRDTSSLHNLTSGLPAGLRLFCSDELTWGHWLADAIADVSHEMSMWGGTPWICAQCGRSSYDPPAAAHCVIYR